MKKMTMVAAVLVGGVGGYAYYALVGCRTGACPLQSNPYFSVLWGALLGYLAADAVTEFIRKRRSAS